MVIFTKFEMYYGKKRSDDVNTTAQGDVEDGGASRVINANSSFIKWDRRAHSAVGLGLGDPNHECTAHCTTPLIMAARNASPDEMEMALEAGGNVNGRDCTGRTALHWAVCMGKFGFFKKVQDFKR